MPKQTNLVPATEFSPEEQHALGTALAQIKPRYAEFVRSYLTNGGNGASAARAAGFGGKRNVRTAAYRLLQRPDVTKALDTFKAILARRTAFDFDSASNMLLDSIGFAKETGNATAYVRAAELMAKLHGHLNDRMDIRHQGDVTFMFPERRTHEEKVVEHA